MNITILNGNPDARNQSFDGYLERLAETLTAARNRVTALTLRDMDINYCFGCFGCWVQTPGECTAKDDSARVCRAAINSDLTLFASPVVMGFPSALLKKTMDKMIPLIHPYFAVVHNEAHHCARYERYPLLGLLLEAGPDADDVRIISQIFSRTALNLKSRLALVQLTDRPVEETARAIANAVLTIFNGSPRGAKGNTPILLEQFLKGFTSVPGRSYEMFHLNHVKDTERFQQAFAEAEGVLLGFPLYTDAMPGLVKAFIETLEPFCGRPGNPPIGFLVQSGFPEAAHSRRIERYLERLAARLGGPYLGTIVKGNCEGVRLMPEKMNRQLFTALFEVGKTFGETGRFDQALLRNLAQPERYPGYMAPFFKILVKTKFANMYWDNQLKENGVYEQRFARPYVE